MDWEIDGLFVLACLFVLAGSASDTNIMSGMTSAFLLLTHEVCVGSSCLSKEIRSSHTTSPLNNAHEVVCSSQMTSAFVFNA